MAYIGRDIQYGTFSKQSLTPDGSTVTFTLDQGVADATNLLLSNGGVIQEPNVAYTASGTTLTMSAAPAATDVIWITYLGKELTVVDLSAKSDLAFQVGTGDGSNVNPIATLDRVTPSAESIMVMTDGVTQVPGTDYTVNGTTLTFTTAPANGVKILVYFLGIAQGIGTPSDNTVTDSKIVGMSSSKLSGALPAIDGSALTNMPAELPAAGSSGNLLTSDGASWASTAPAGGGSWNLIGTAVASNSATLIITGLDSTYDTYACAMADMHPSEAASPCIRMGDSNGIDSAGGNYKWHNTRNEWEHNTSTNNHASNSDDEIKLTLGLAGPGSGEGWGGFFYLHRPADSQILPHISGHGSYIPQADDGFTVVFSAARSSAITLDRIQFHFGSGNIVSGRFTVWGISHS